MNRDKNSWFGFKLTQKQAVSIFILSLIGMLILTFLTLSTIYPYLIMTLTSSYYNIDYYIGMLIAMLPIYLIIIVFLIICIYSLIKSRIIAKFYSELMFSKDSEARIPLFCSNCGNKMIGAEKFCKICGQERK